MEQLLLSFIDTLNLMLLPVKEFNIPYLTSIQIQLEELEGDYYTFLHESNLKKLYNEGYLTLEVIRRVEEVKNRINGFDKSLWNPNDFVDNDKWKIVRNDVVEILKKEMIK